MSFWGGRETFITPFIPLILRGIRRESLSEGVTGKFFQNPPLKVRGARGVMKERLPILRWNLWKKLDY